VFGRALKKINNIDEFQSADIERKHEGPSYIITDQQFAHFSRLVLLIFFQFFCWAGFRPMATWCLTQRGHSH